MRLWTVNGRERSKEGLKSQLQADNHRSFCFVFSFTLFYTAFNGNVSMCSLLKKVLPVEFIYTKEHRTLLALRVG